VSSSVPPPGFDRSRKNVSLVLSSSASARTSTVTMADVVPASMVAVP
jgi:hypothetical protein